MDEGIIVLLLGVIVFFCLQALFVVMQVLFKSWIEETKQIAREAAGRSLAIGFVNALLISALSLGFYLLGDSSGVAFFSLLGLLLTTALVIGMLFGLTAMVVLVAERMLPEAQGWRQTVGGGAAVVLACLTPYVGWFAMFPYVIFRGLGGFIQSLARAWRARRDRGRQEDAD